MSVCQRKQTSAQTDKSSAQQSGRLGGGHCVIASYIQTVHTDVQYVSTGHIFFPFVVFLLLCVCCQYLLFVYYYFIIDYVVVISILRIFIVVVPNNHSVDVVFAVFDGFN